MPNANIILLLNLLTVDHQCNLGTCLIVLLNKAMSIVMWIEQLSLCLPLVYKIYKLHNRVHNTIRLVTPSTT